jgi:DNA topoisomerase-2
MEYKELDLHQHTLKRPDTYVGSIRSQTSPEYISSEDMTQITLQEINYIPALLRIFVEALSNAVDNVVRSKEHGVECKSIKVTINQETGETSVWNDGLTIPIGDSTNYIPEMLFGRLLTSSNYNDEEERYTSGRNGLGITLTNIFSTEFKVQLVSDGNMYRQEWSNNMKNKGKPKITKSKLKGYTQVTWTPDFQYFSVPGYTMDFVRLMYRYVMDSAMATGVSVYLNDVKLPIKQFKDYVGLYSSDKHRLLLESRESQCVLIPSQGTFQTVSFVNGVYTKNGGVHVDAWSDAVFKPLSTKLKLQPKDVKPYFMVFVNCRVPNPEFSNQSKTKMTGPKISTSVESKHVKALCGWPFMDEIKKLRDMKEMMTLKKTEKKRFKSIEGFDQANKAGGKDSVKCSLILCEGLSAKTYAVMGIEQGSWVGGEKLKGRDWYGILALRGKLLNTRNAKADSIAANKEITNIIQILGLQYGMDYSVDSNYKQLRYGRVMILTDQDLDGFHIGGLIINMFDHLFPSLIRRPDFLTSMQTPIIKINLKTPLRFYDSVSAKRYIEKHQPSSKLVKYYKGLGTSSDKDIEETFGKRVVIFTMDDNSRANINLAFSNDQSNTRKNWIANYKENEVEYTEDNNMFGLNVSDFINYELIKFSIADCKRSLPNLVDGLKESQRKILYACFLKNLNQPLKVAQLGAYVAEKTCYHHGENSLSDTIIKMNQDFVGANNVPLLLKDGQHGTRLQLGKDAASPRYIFTKLASRTRSIFHSDDDAILTSLYDDGDTIEPEYYCPIIPMILVNGGEGIGTGWSTSIPCYNPADIVSWIKNWLSETDTGELIPWYNGFEGRIVPVSKHKFETHGVAKQDGKKIVVTEIPIGISIEKYKEHLEELRDSKKIKSVKNYSKPNKVHFELVIEDGFDVSQLKLTSAITTTNLVLFDENNSIHKYDTVEDIMESFCGVRFKYYTMRKENLLKRLEEDKKVLKNRRRFLKKVMNDELVLRNRDEESILADMKRMEFTDIENLLALPVRSFSSQKISALDSKIDELRVKIEETTRATEKQLWLNDLNSIRF